jgi:hypothetical protein
MMPSIDPVSGENALQGAARAEQPASPVKNPEFAAELASAIRHDKKTSKKALSRGKEDVRRHDPLSILHPSDWNATHLTADELDAMAKLPKDEAKEVLSLLLECRKRFMQGIKSSLLCLETSIRDLRNDMPDALRTRYRDTIDSLKADFTRGFGVDFDSVDVPSNRPLAPLLFRLEQIADSLPPSILKKMETLLDR